MYQEKNRLKRRLAVLKDTFQRKSLRFLIYRIEWNLAKYFGYLPKRPLNIDIELSDACNLRCTMCIHGLDGLPSVGYMEYETAESLLLESAKLKIPAVKFNWRGEAGLHPKLVELVEMASRLGFVDIQLNTNLVSMDQRKLERLVFSGIHRIIVSCDGATKETYEKIRIGSNFERLLSNLETIRTLRLKHKLTYPKVRVQFVKQVDNVHEVDKFLLDFDHLADDLRIAEVSNRGTDGIVSVGDQYAVGRKRCEQPWQRLIISKDGKYHPCCNDWDQLYELGNIDNDSIHDAWNSIKLDSLRKANISNELDEHPLCKNCFVPESYIWKSAEEYKRAVDQSIAFGRKRK